MIIDFIKAGLTWLDVDLVRNEVQHIVPAMDPEVYTDRAGIKYFLDLDLPEYPMSTNFDTMITLEGREKPPVTSSGALIYEGCAFRLEELLAGQLTITPPLRNETLLSAVASLTTRYRVRERVEPALADRTLPTRTAMRAGLALRDFVGYGHHFFSRHQPEKKQFLTWHPNNKLVSPTQRDFLYFLLSFSPLPQEIRLRVRTTRQDGSRPVITVCSITGLRQFQVVCAQVGPTELSLADDVVSYEVWLSDENNERFTEVRSFNIDRRDQAFERCLIYSNSFGAFDSIRLTGIASQETDVIRNKSRKERQTGMDLDFSELQVISVSENSGIKLSTGFFELNAATYLDYLRELMLAEVIFMNTDHGFEAMNLLTTNLEYSKDRSGLIERTFELERTYSDKNYSRLGAVSKIPGRATKWIGLSAKAVLDSFGKRTGYLGFERLQKVYQDDGSKVIPYSIKPNIPGDPDYITPKLQPSIPPGSTPYPSEVISRVSTFRRNNCGTGYLGAAPTIIVPAGSYGGELPGDANELAEIKWKSLDTQAYANANGSCALNNVPFHFAIFHKIDNAWVGDSGYPVVDLRINGQLDAVSNTVATSPFTNRLSEATYLPGMYDLVVEVEYHHAPFYPVRLKIASKGLEIITTGPGFYTFENVEISSSDEPLTIEVLQV